MIAEPTPYQLVTYLQVIKYVINNCNSNLYSWDYSWRESGLTKYYLDITIFKKGICKTKVSAVHVSLLVKIIYLENLMVAPMDCAMKTVV